MSCPSPYSYNEYNPYPYDRCGELTEEEKIKKEKVRVLEEKRKRIEKQTENFNTSTGTCHSSRPCFEMNTRCSCIMTEMSIEEILKIREEYIQIISERQDILHLKENIRLIEGEECYQWRSYRGMRYRCLEHWYLHENEEVYTFTAVSDYNKPKVSHEMQAISGYDTMYEFYMHFVLDDFNCSPYEKYKEELLHMKIVCDHELKIFDRIDKTLERIKSQEERKNALKIKKEKEADKNNPIKKEKEADKNNPRKEKSLNERAREMNLIIQRNRRRGIKRNPVNDEKELTREKSTSEKIKEAVIHFFS